MMNKQQLAVVTLVTVGFIPLDASLAYAIPSAQARCSFSGQSSISPEGFKQLSTLAATVSNGTSARRIIVHLAADICVDPGAEVRISYSVDGGAPAVFGPTNFANHQEFCETRSTLAIIPLAAGNHTIRPFWRVSGVGGKRADFVQGCVTAEGRTQ